MNPFVVVELLSPGTEEGDLIQVPEEELTTAQEEAEFAREKAEAAQRKIDKLAEKLRELGGASQF